MPRFFYKTAFSRNIGFVSEAEQYALRCKRVAIAGLGGVGGHHLLALTRLGIGAFTLADFDSFELPNFNRQAGAAVSSLGKKKLDVMIAAARDINPELDIRSFPDGINTANLEEFLRGADLYLDGLDFFALTPRRAIFAACNELHVPAITAGPIGIGSAFMVFMPQGMSFEDYFQMEGCDEHQQSLRFLIGMAPRGLHRQYLIDPTQLDLAHHKTTSTPMGCYLAAAVAATEALKILLKRGPIYAAPYLQLYDPYPGKFMRLRIAYGNRHWLQRLRIMVGYHKMMSMLQQSSTKTESIKELPDNILIKILDIARWAPSGDNTQPWRFQILSDRSMYIFLRDDSANDVFDFEGKPGLMACGTLIENIRLAATYYKFDIRWRYLGKEGQYDRIEINFIENSSIAVDPLYSQIAQRSVRRDHYRHIQLTQAQKAALQQAVGGAFELRWYESLSERLQVAHVTAQASDVRFRIKEAFLLHQRVIDWERDFSPDRLPVNAINITSMSKLLIRWSLKSWQRNSIMVRLFGTRTAQLEFDYLPAIHSAAQFLLFRRAGEPKNAEEWLEAGIALQRFWLTTTQLGLVMQPNFSPVVFSYYVRHKIAFTCCSEVLPRVHRLAQEVEALAQGKGASLIFLGRIGTPRHYSVNSRSTRLPIEQLMK